MKKTTVYLPDDLKRDVERIAAATARSEAQVVRHAISEMVTRSKRPRPRGALFASGDPSLSETVDVALSGFGER